MKNPAFLIVCVMIAAAPLFRGSVHAWAQTVIQAMVALAGLCWCSKRCGQRRGGSGHPGVRR
jgi:hypothetical protein